MAHVVLRRLVASLGILVLVSAVVFVLVALIPGDPAVILAGEGATPQRVAYFREALGLNDPVWVRYGHWLWNALHGDLGQSLATSAPVASLLGPPLGVTVSLVAVTLLFSSIIGLILGVAAAARPASWLDRVVTIVSSVAIAVPPFWVGLLLVAFFAVRQRLFPALGYVPLTESPATWAWHLALPAVALGALPGAEFALQLREGIIAELQRDYIQVGLAKGLDERTLLFKHALKNAAIPVVTVFGYRAGQLLGGVVTIETVFNLPGLGSIAVGSVLSRDVTVLLGMVVISTIAVVLINLVTDMSYTYLNPKLREA